MSEPLDAGETEKLTREILALIKARGRGMPIQEVVDALSLSFDEAQTALEKLEAQGRVVRLTGLTPDDRSVTFDLTHSSESRAR